MSSRPSRGAARLAAILDALPDALLLVNANGTVVNANSIALEVMESPGTGLVGRGVLDLLPDFDSKLIPGSMRRPGEDEGGRARPKRMVARRTDGSEFPVEVTAAHLDGRDAYREPQPSYTGDELLMLVVRDLSQTVDTEAELARSQRQTEMILRAAAEGVVGTDTDGRVVLVNPAAAQILGYRATDLGNRELHGLVQHSRADGSPFPFEESPLADTLRSGRKHRVRGQVLWNKAGQPVAVDLTTSPVRDGEQLVGAVMTFTDRRSYDALAARHAQLLSVLGDSLRGPLEELRGELATLAADDAGQLWPEANQLLHHLAAGYSRMTTLVDNVLSFQRLDAGGEKLDKKKVLIDGVVKAGVDGAVELIGPGRAQFAVHAPTIEAEVDAERISTALAHLVADVAGVDATGKTRQGSGYMDSTIVVAAAQRGEVVRIEVRGPYEGGSPVHEPIVRGIVEAHGGVLQTVEVPGAPGGAYVLELPLGAGAGTVTLPEPEEAPPAEPGTEGGPGQVSGGRRARRGVDAFLDDDSAADAGADAAPGKEAGNGPGTGLAKADQSPDGADGGTPWRCRPGGAGAARPRPWHGPATALPRARPVPVNPAGLGGSGTGRRRARTGDGSGGDAMRQRPSGRPRAAAPAGHRHARAPAHAGASRTGASRAGAPFPGPRAADGAPRRAAACPGHGGTGAAGRPVPATGLGPTPVPMPPPMPPSPASPLPYGPSPPRAASRCPRPDSRLRSRRRPAAGAEADAEAPGGRRGRRWARPSPAPRAPKPPPGGLTRRSGPRSPRDASHRAAACAARHPGLAGAGGPYRPRGLGRRRADRRTRSPPAAGHPAEAAGAPISVRALGSLGQGGGAGDTNGSGRRRRLAEPAPEGRAFAIGAPEEGSAEGPEPLDGPGGAVEVVNRTVPRPVDDELPPEPLDNPRRLLVWPAPDAQTQAALSDRGYRPVIVHSREEVDAQIAAFPAALFVDPLTGPITRTALQSLRQAAVAAEVPVLVTAGLGHATREAAYGADPAVLLKALAPRDSEQHPSRVLLIEEHDEIATALTAALERRGMQVARADADTDAVELATRMRPNLVVMDLMQVRRRRAGIVDWLRANGQLNHTPLVVYTATGIEPSELPRLASGESVLFLAERSTTADVQGRIVDLLAKIGTN
ncbi:PAS domain-containing protein [Streptomyces sp. ZAF1911]|uniref:response regulator n=1 Tax=Streptomyces sp. ZAF1911 TaxID=2944129 RepID=UPI00237B43A8|nr:PAS domain-containing protein [Streptomyces sp. ZAF1911]MDD9377409.1 PAS domain-containing protein [Streptomyces sp. ZAF1911]